MAGPERIEWRRSFPFRSLAFAGWYASAAGLAIVLSLLLFGDEPERLRDGGVNVLAVVPTVVCVLAGLGVVPVVLSVVRRPRVGANHFALTVRPAWIRTLVLPWSRVAEVAVGEIGGEPYLLVRCRVGVDTMGDSPHWIDQRLLRDLRRAGSRQARRFDLAVRLRDFAGSVDGQLAALAAFAPDDVAFTSDLPTR